MKDEFKITNHVFVPKHEIMDSKDSEKMLKNFDIEKNQLPVLNKEDPVVKEIGAKKGDIVKITRNSQTAGKSEYFRIVK